jgi:hypothetical protein
MENKETENLPYQNYLCPVCKHLMVHDVAIFLTHTKAHILELLRTHYPEWGTGYGDLKLESGGIRHDEKIEKPN